MNEAAIVEAVRTPIARGKPVVGDLSVFHATQLLALSIKGVIQNARIDFDDIEQVYGGCVTQAGEQAGNVSRITWLSLGENWTTGACTIDTQCGPKIARGVQGSPCTQRNVRLEGFRD